jgi:hypothetical protein
MRIDPAAAELDAVPVVLTPSIFKNADEAPNEENAACHAASVIPVFDVEPVLAIDSHNPDPPPTWSEFVPVTSPKSADAVPVTRCPTVEIEIELAPGGV